MKSSTGTPTSGNVSVDKSKKKGRPRKSLFLPTRIPDKKVVGSRKYNEARYRRHVDLNILASRRYRAKRNEMRNALEEEAKVLEEKNKALRRKLESYERIRDKLVSIMKQEVSTLVTKANAQ